MDAQKVQSVTVERKGGGLMRVRLCSNLERLRGARGPSYRATKRRASFFAVLELETCAYKRHKHPPEQPEPPALIHDLVQRILHKPSRSRPLQERNQVSHLDFVEDHLRRDPTFVGER